MGSAVGAATMEAASAQGSLLNKVYEMQCAQQQQQQSTIFTVVGGRMVSSGSPMPLNGQQLMMQLDGITSAMTGMSVQEEAGLIHIRGGGVPLQPSLPQERPCLPRQHGRALSTFLTGIGTAPPDQLQQQQEQQQHLEQQQLEYQLQLMHLQQQHQQLPLHQPQSCPAVSDHQVPDMETSSLNMNLPMDSDFHCGSGRVLKRPDLLPLGNFF